MSTEKVENQTTVEIDDTQAPAPQAEQITVSQIEGDLDPRELATAKEMGLVVEDKKEPPAPEKEKPAEKAEVDEADEKFILDAIKQDDITADDEKKVLKKLDKVAQAYYWEKKSERRKRQQAEIDRDFTKTKLKAAEEELAKLRKPKDEIDDIFKDETKTETPKPAEPDPEEVKANAGMLAAKLDELDIKARQEYKDYDDVINLAIDLSNRGMELFKDNPKQLARARKAFNDWQSLAANALNSNDPYTAADAAYELGKMHPDYGKQAAEHDAGEEAGTKKADSEKVERAIRNAEKGKTSAAFTGGSKRTVSFDDLTAADAARMTDEQYAKLPREVRERILRQT